MVNLNNPTTAMQIKKHVDSFELAREFADLRSVASYEQGTISQFQFSDGSALAFGSTMQSINIIVWNN